MNMNLIAATVIFIVLLVPAGADGYFLRGLLLGDKLRYHVEEGITGQNLIDFTWEKDYHYYYYPICQEVAENVTPQIYFPRAL